MSLTPLTPPAVDALQTALKSRGYRGMYADTGVAPRTLQRALSGLPLAPATIARLSRLAPRVRTAEEFAPGAPKAKLAPRMRDGTYAWSIETIRAARDAQLRGEFELPAALAEAMRTDDALFCAYNNRVAPQSAIATKLMPHESSRGKAVAARAALSVFVSRSTLEGIHGTLANHGVAIGHNEREVNDDGTAIDFRLVEWPIEHVRWDPIREVLTTRVREGLQLVDILHGDGEWVVFRKFGVKPWTQDACVLPGALLWGAHAMTLADWAGASRAHGLARVIGELPEGTALKDENGNLSPQAQAFLDLLGDIVSGEHGAGIRPTNSKTDFLTNNSTAWQIFSELSQNREKAAARIYLGTDATLGSIGGAPGIDISALFGVATTRLQGDLSAIESALDTGLYQPWCAVNYGDSRYSPALRYQLPDPDADTKRAERAAQRERLNTAIQTMRDSKLEVTQEVVDTLAGEFGVDPSPKLASDKTQTSTIQLAPADIAKVVRVREARASQGLDPFSVDNPGDPRDDMTLTELETWTIAKADAQVKAAPEAPTEVVPNEVVPNEVAPTEAAPTEAAPTEAAPTA